MCAPAIRLSNTTRPSQYRTGFSALVIHPFYLQLLHDHRHNLRLLDEHFCRDRILVQTDHLSCLRVSPTSLSVVPVNPTFLTVPRVKVYFPFGIIFWQNLPLPIPSSIKRSLFPHHSPTISPSHQAFPTITNSIPSSGYSVNQPLLEC
jgi:hypothetical protein